MPNVAVPTLLQGYFFHIIVILLVNIDVMFFKLLFVELMLHSVLLVLLLPRECRVNNPRLQFNVSLICWYLL